MTNNEWMNDLCMEEKATFLAVFNYRSTRHAALKNDETIEESLTIAAHSMNSYPPIVKRKIERWLQDRRE